MVLDSGIVRSENSVPHLVIAEKRRSQWERLWLVKMFWISRLAGSAQPV